MDVYQEAPFGLTLDELKALDQVRLRLSQLTFSLSSLWQTVYTSNPLPDPATLQSFHNILQKTLSSLNDVLTENAHLFSRVAVHPSTNFNGRQYENILHSLIRKKMETVAEMWADEGRAAAVASLPQSFAPYCSFSSLSSILVPAAASGNQSQQHVAMTAVEKEEDEKKRLEKYWKHEANLADRIADILGEKLRDFVTTQEASVFTKEEKESGMPLEQVPTGLKRDLVKMEREMFGDGVDEGEKGEDVAMLDQQQQQYQKDQKANHQPDMIVQGTRPEQLFWFGIRGDFSLPSTVQPPEVVGRESARNKSGGGGVSMAVRGVSGSGSAAV